MKNIAVGQKWKLKQDLWEGACSLAVGDVVTVENIYGEDIYYAPGAFLDRGRLSEQGFSHHFELVEDLPPEVQYRELPDWGAAYKITSLGTDDDGEMQYEVLVKSQNQNKTWGTTWIGEDNISATEPITKEEFDNFLPVEEKSEPMPENDPVKHPAHYTSDPSGVECIQVTRHRNFNIGNAIKYLWRSGLKQSADKTSLEKQIEDLDKAIFYIEDEKKRLLAEEN